MYTYYGAPAVAPAGCHSNVGEASQAPDDSAAQVVQAITCEVPEDLEVKKRQVLEARAAQGEVNICTKSNVVKKMRKVVQSVTCEVCKMQFSSLHDLRGHETGKKHKKKNLWKNLKKLQDSMTPKQENPLNGAVGASTAPAAAVADGMMPAVQPKKNKSSAATPDDLEVKNSRLLEAGAAQGELKTCTMSNVVKKIPKVVQLVTCEVCKMQLNNLHDLRSHETGKKHKKNLEKLQDSTTPEPAKPPNDAVGASTEPAAAAVADTVMSAVQPKKNESSTATPEDLEVKKRRVLEAGAAQGELEICTMSNAVKKIPKVVQPVTCEVCKMQFNSLYILRGHETGKKHKKNLEKLQDSITPEPAKPPNDAVGASTEPAAVADGVTPAVQPKKNKRPASTPEDLEAKRRRVVEHGAAEGEVKICTTCNVVANCQKDHEVHIAGHNHNAKLQRQQQVQ